MSPPNRLHPSSAPVDLHLSALRLSPPRSSPHPVRRLAWCPGGTRPNNTFDRPDMAVTPAASPVHGRHTLLATAVGRPQIGNGGATGVGKTNGDRPATRPLIHSRVALA